MRSGFIYPSNVGTDISRLVCGDGIGAVAIRGRRKLLIAGIWRRRSRASLHTDRTDGRN